MRHPHKLHTASEQGFTLVELSIVLVIMALVMGAGFAMLTAQIDSQRQAASRVKQEAVRTALINFISRNSRLPCPARPAATAADADFGVEAATPGTCTGITSTGAAPAVVVTGLIPWVSLGLSQEATTDGFYNNFSYQVVVSATNLTTQTIAGMRGYITLHSSGPGVLGAAPAGNQINECSGGLAFNPCAAVAVVLSHGRNGFGGFMANGVRRSTAETGADEQANADDDSLFVRKDFSENGANPFDDLVLALTPNDLLSPLTQNGALKDYRAAINATTEQMKGAIFANAIANKTATPPITYPIPSVAWFGSNLPATDPWGQAFTYTPNPLVPTISASTAPNLEAFRLASIGPDGTLGNSDDLTVIVKVAEVQAAIAKGGF